MDKPPQPHRKADQQNKPVILLAEDDETIRNLVATVLAKAGYQVLVAENGEAALEAYRQFGGQIDLLLTDVVMPGMDGYQLAHSLSELQHNVKIAFTTGYSQEFSVPEKVVINKPFTPQGLVQAIKKIVGK